MNKLVLVLLPVVLVIAMGAWAFKSGWFGGEQQQQALPAEGEIVLYWGTTCPHCKVLKEWMAEKKIEEKVKVILKEVYENRTNQKELMAVAGKCGIVANQVGVPLLYAEGKCMIGTDPIESYLSQKAGIETAAEVKEEAK